MKTGVPVVKVDAELADLIPNYMSNRWADLRTARQLLIARDFDELSRMAHRIRGSAASYGFVALGDIIQVLETAAVEQDAAATEVQLGAFEAFLHTVRIEYC